MTRAEIDNIIKDKMDECGLRNYRVAWSLNPAELHVLVEGELKKRRISTRMTKRALKALLDDLEFWAGRSTKWTGKGGIVEVTE